MADAVKRQLASPEGLQNVISAAAQYRDALTQAAAPRTDELARQIQEVTKKIRNLVDTLASGISSKAITDQLVKLEDEKARLEAAERNIKAATREVGLTDAEIAEGLTKLSLTDEKTQEGRRVLLSIVARVVVFTDHVDVYTILGPDGQKPDLDAAAKDFITTMGQTSLAPILFIKLFKSAFWRLSAVNDENGSPLLSGRAFFMQRPPSGAEWRKAVRLARKYT